MCLQYPNIYIHSARVVFTIAYFARSLIVQTLLMGLHLLVHILLCVKPIVYSPDAIRKINTYNILLSVDSANP